MIMNRCWWWYVLVLAAALLAAGAAPGAPAPQHVTVKLGDYHFEPDTIHAYKNELLVLTLVNLDKVTPHNLSLRAPEAGMYIDINIPAGHSVNVELTPRATGNWTFYCNKKLLFMKSHRERGMQGTLVVTDHP